MISPFWRLSTGLLQEESKLAPPLTFLAEVHTMAESATLVLSDLCPSPLRQDTVQHTISKKGEMHIGSASTTAGDN